MPLAEITAAVTSAKNVLEFVKGAKSAIDNAKITEMLSGVYDKLIAAQAETLQIQSDLNALTEQKENLRKKLLEFEDWESTEKEYQLTKICPKIFVYVYKKQPDSDDPEHWLCPNCWQEKKKSILQGKGSQTYGCPRCKFVMVNSNDPAPRPFRPRRVGFIGGF